MEIKGTIMMLATAAEDHAARTDTAITRHFRSTIDTLCDHWGLTYECGMGTWTLTRRMMVTLDDPDEPDELVEEDVQLHQMFDNRGRGGLIEATNYEDDRAQLYFKGTPTQEQMLLDVWETIGELLRIQTELGELSHARFLDFMESC